jgi:hypothetical protein
LVARCDESDRHAVEYEQGNERAPRTVEPLNGFDVRAGSGNLGATKAEKN